MSESLAVSDVLGRIYSRTPGAEVNSFITLEACCQIAYTRTHRFPYMPDGLPVVSALQCLIFPDLHEKSGLILIHIFLITSEISNLHFICSFAF